MATINLSDLDPKLIEAVKRDVQKVFEEEAEGWQAYQERKYPHLSWLRSRLAALRLQFAGQEEQDAVRRIYWSCVNLTGDVDWEIADQMYEDWRKEYNDGRQTTRDI